MKNTQQLLNKIHEHTERAESPITYGYVGDGLSPAERLLKDAFVGELMTKRTFFGNLVQTLVLHGMLWLSTHGWAAKSKPETQAEKLVVGMKDYKVLRKTKNRQLGDEDIVMDKIYPEGRGRSVSRKETIDSWLEADFITLDQAQKLRAIAGKKGQRLI